MKLTDAELGPIANRDSLYGDRIKPGLDNAVYDRRALLGHIDALTAERDRLHKSASLFVSAARRDGWPVIRHEYFKDMCAALSPRDGCADEGKQ